MGDDGTINRWRMDFNSTQLATSDANGWALMDVGFGTSNISISLPTGWRNMVPSDGKHSFTSNSGPVFGKNYGIRDLFEPPSNISLSNSELSENAGVNAMVGFLSSTDPDVGDTFTYSLVAGVGATDNAAFNINGTRLRAVDSLNFENKSTYSVRIRSTDSHGIFFEKVFTIHVTNQNESPTNIALSSNSIAENLGANTLVGLLSTTDQDAGETFTYTLVAGTGDANNAAFNISGSNLRATNSFNYES